MVVGWHSINDSGGEELQRRQRAEDCVEDPCFSSPQKAKAGGEDTISKSLVMHLNVRGSCISLCNWQLLKSPHFQKNQY